MQISREQYEADIRNAKAQSLRDVVVDLGLADTDRHISWRTADVIEYLRIAADEIENPL